MEDGRRKMEDLRWKMEDGRLKIEDGKRNKFYRKGVQVDLSLFFR
jgi:hypothetical protein